MDPNPLEAKNVKDLLLNVEGSLILWMFLIVDSTAAAPAAAAVATAEETPKESNEDVLSPP